MKTAHNTLSIFGEIALMYNCLGLVIVASILIRFVISENQITTSNNAMVVLLISILLAIWFFVNFCVFLFLRRNCTKGICITELIFSLLTVNLFYFLASIFGLVALKKEAKEKEEKKEEGNYGINAMP